MKYVPKKLKEQANTLVNSVNINRAPWKDLNLKARVWMKKN